MPAAPRLPPPRLVLVAHGTRRPGGNALARELADRAGGALGVPAEAAYVELADPTLADLVAGLPAGHGSVAVVPLLLSTGYHVRTDLPEACGLAPEGVDVALGRPLGPDPALARAASERLDEAGAAPDQPVVLVAAGSSDPDAGSDLAAAARMLGEVRGTDVRLATLDGRGERPEEVVRPGDAVSPYLLSPGLFSRRCAEVGRAAGATVVGDVLGDHAAVVGLVVERARALLGA